MLSLARHARLLALLRLVPCSALEFKFTTMFKFSYITLQYRHTESLTLYE